jgi:hypothetical protein
MAGIHTIGATRAKPGQTSGMGIALVFGAALVCTLAITVAIVRHFSVEEPSEAVQACISRLYSPYNPKDLNQCTAACMTCSAGVRTTCSTSCSLRGAR